METIELTLQSGPGRWAGHSRDWLKVRSEALVQYKQGDRARVVVVMIYRDEFHQRDAASGFKDVRQVHVFSA